jgi:hypothetical protein
VLGAGPDAGSVDLEDQGDDPSLTSVTADEAGDTVQHDERVPVTDS